MKRFLVLLCVLALVFAFPAFAETTPSLTATSTISEDGQTVTLVVNITGGSAVCGGSLDLIYDPSLLTCETVTAGSALKNTTFIGNKNYDNDTIRAAWISTTGLAADGEVVTITFRTIPGIQDQTAQIALSNVSVFDMTSASIAASANGTSVVIPAGEAPDQPETPPSDDPRDDPLPGDDPEEKPGEHPTDEPKEDPEETPDENDSAVISPIPAAPAEEEKDPEVFLMSFVDGPEAAYYYDAVLWAVQNNVTTGTSETTFSPDASCNRAQAVTFLWRAAGSPEPVGTSNPFSDVSADAYYYKAVLWALENGITTGTGDGSTFSPDTIVTRAQIVTFIYRSVQANGGGFQGAWMFRLPFTDAPDWAFEAIAWCYMNDITTGTSDTTFSPDASCTRAQIVTFLYRHFAD